jgi:hypothetical protein
MGALKSINKNDKGKSVMDMSPSELRDLVESQVLIIDSMKIQLDSVWDLLAKHGLVTDLPCEKRKFIRSGLSETQMIPGEPTLFAFV